MGSPDSITSSSALASTGVEPDRLSAGEIDASGRTPLLLLFASASLWLFFGVALMLISSIKLHGPGFLADCPMLTLGRVRPAGFNALLYGFVAQAGLGAALWLLARLGGNRLVALPALGVGWVFWNSGLGLGIWGILIGHSSGIPWLELPRAAAVVLFLAYLLLSLPALLTFAVRRVLSLYVSQWYLLAALFWFAWVFSAAVLLLLVWPVRGVAQAVVGAWFSGSLLQAWLSPLGLALLFYFIPKLAGRPLYSQSVAAFGFWTQAFLGGWTGLTQLVGGPVPAWLVSVSIAANMTMLVPLVCVGWNLGLTAQGRLGHLRESPVGRFILFAALAYLVSGALGILLGFRSVSLITHFTYAPVAVTLLHLMGFVGMALLAVIYYVVPRVLGLSWDTRWMQAHFLLATVGTGLIFLALFAGGLVQGLRLNNTTTPFVDVVKTTVPFVGLATGGWMLLLIAQGLFLWQLGGLLARFTRPARLAAWAFLSGADLPQAEVRA